jgi:membrane protease YdiL (CAAX protease family)
MTDQTLDADTRAAAAEPYGWIGLPLSLIAIAVLAVALCALVGAAAFGVEAAIVGWRVAMVRLSGLIEVIKGDPRTGEFIALCLSIAVYLAIAVVIFGLARFRGGARWRDLIAWHPWKPRRRMGLFAAVAGVTLLYSFIANAALAYFYPASQDWVTLPSGGLSIALFFVVAALSAPLTEELVFRGWLYTALRAKLGVAASLIVSSILFALAHWESTHLYALVVFPVGLALGFIRERAGSLKASMTFHALYNTVAFTLIWFGK